jgi:hypothetical protein
MNLGLPSDFQNIGVSTLAFWMIMPRETNFSGSLNYFLALCSATINTATLQEFSLGSDRYTHNAEFAVQPLPSIAMSQARLALLTFWFRQSMKISAEGAIHLAIRENLMGSYTFDLYYPCR